MSTSFVKLWNKNAYHKREAVARMAADDLYHYVLDEPYKPSTEDILFIIKESEQAPEHIRVEAIRALSLLIEDSLVEYLDNKQIQLSLFKNWFNSDSSKIIHAAIVYTWIIYLHEAIPYIREFVKEHSDIKKSAGARFHSVTLAARTIRVLCGAMIREYRDKITKKVA